MIIEGTICTLRPLTIEDAELTLSWRLGSRARFLQRGAKTVKEQKGWIKSKIKTTDKNYIIEYLGQPVGMIALYDISIPYKTLQMGRFLIGEEELVGSAPVAFEAELLLSDYVFDVMGMHKIYGDVMEDNHSMLKMRTYLGYCKDGVLRDHYVYDGDFKDTVAISLLEEEYRATCRPKLKSLINLYSRQKK